MADVVYLHVGAPKTGTTYLQDRLYLNRASLARHGVHYPVGMRHNMFGAALDLLDAPWGGQREHYRGDWGHLVSRVRRASGRVVVSHEILSACSAEQAAQAMRDLRGTEVHLVYSARDVARQLPADWQEGLKYNKTWTFKSYVRKAKQASRRDPSMWLWRTQSLPDVLNRWAQGLPPEHVHLVTAPHAPGTDELWRRYCRAFDIEPAWAPLDSEQTNVSIGVDEAALVRALNARLRRLDLDPVAYGTLVRQLLVHETLARREGMRKATLGPRHHAWAGEVAEEWIAWAEGSRIDVVGDLDDLRPRPPEDPERWTSPDRPRQRKVNDAALDALVALLLELAERPDPEQSTSARLSRAARRLTGQE